MVTLTEQLSLELLRGTLIVRVAITSNETGVVILIHLTTSRGRNGVVMGAYLPGRNEWSNLLLLNLIIMAKKNMCMEVDTSWLNSIPAKTAKEMMSKANPKAKVYTKAEIADEKAKMAPKKKMSSFLSRKKRMK